MGTPFIAELKICSFNFPPRGWALCNGQLLPINQNQALFSLLGTTYGGNGQTTFGLPDLRGRTPIHLGQGFVQGQVAGQENHTLIMSELPAHNHLMSASSAVADQGSPVGNFLASPANVQAYAASSNTAMISTTTNVGGSQPHTNLQPYLVLNIIIALQGIFPSRN